MATLITDPEIEQRIRAQRAEWGADRFDEVWEGIYLMTPLPNSEHAEIQTTLAAVFRFALGFDSPVKVYTGVNVSDRAEGWTENYRCPDVVVVLPGSTARDCGAFHLGGPDFVIEIVSPYDHSREKIEFYEDVSVRRVAVGGPRSVGIGAVSAEQWPPRSGWPIAARAAGYLTKRRAAAEFSARQGRNSASD